MLLISYILIICLVLLGLFFFFKQKTAYDMRISDWSSDVCSSDLFELRLFGNMRVDGAISAHPSASEPGRESVGERVRRRLAHRAALQPQLARAECFEPRHRQADHVEAETGIDRIAQGVDPLGEQTHHQLGVACRGAGLDRNRPRQPVAAKEGRAKLPSALAAFGHCGDRLPPQSSELQSLMRISYAVFCLKKKT